MKATEKKKTAVCNICGKTFEKSAPNQKYCTLECSFKATKLRRKIWVKNNPSYYRRYMRERNKKAKGLTI